MTAIGPERRDSTHVVSLPSSLSTGFNRGRVEVLLFLRDRTAVVFNFAFPALMLLLFGTVFSGTFDSGVRVSHVFAAGMIAYGILTTSFITMGAGLSVDREDGTLKRLRGTPITAVAYVLGKVVLVLVLSVAEVVLLVALGVVVFGMPLPDLAHWLTFGWLFALSVTACSLLGLAASALVRRERTAGTILSVPVVVLQFVSGVFIYPMTQLPTWLSGISALFPVKWMAQGFRHVFLPDVMKAGEVAGRWELGRAALFLAAWCVIGLVLCLTTFRWTDHQR